MNETCTCGWHGGRRPFSFSYRGGRLYAGLLTPERRKCGSNPLRFQADVADSTLERAIEQQCRHRLITFLANTPDKPRAFLHERGAVEHLFQPCVAHADRSVRPPCRLKSHSRRGLVGLNADPVEQVDRRAVARMTDPVAAVIGPHQSHTRLVVREKRGAIGGLPPWLVAKSDAFSFGSPVQVIENRPGISIWRPSAVNAPESGKPRRRPSGSASQTLRHSPLKGSCSDNV
jgi:hypothetical protein